MWPWPSKKSSKNSTPVSPRPLGGSHRIRQRGSSDFQVEEFFAGADFWQPISSRHKTLEEAKTYIKRYEDYFRDLRENDNVYYPPAYEKVKYRAGQ